MAYNLYPLISDGSAVTAPLADTSLVNGWGLSASATSPWWTSNNKSNTSTLYTGLGSKNALTVTVAGGPTGTVANANTAAFVISQNGVSSSSRFLFDTQAGQILGWAPTVNGTQAVVAVDNSSKGALYDGLATLNDRLYAADFHNGRVDSFDSSFKPLTLPFSDPKLPKGFAPFGIQALAGNIFVTYAKQDAAKKVSVPGTGVGYVDEFTPDGALVARVASPHEERPAERAVGARDGAGELRRLQRRPARGQLRQRPDQRLPAARERQVGLQGPGAHRRAARRSRSTACGRSRSATAPPPARRTTCTSWPARAASRTGCSASSPSASGGVRNVRARPPAGPHVLPRAGPPRPTITG